MRPTVDGNGRRARAMRDLLPADMWAFRRVEDAFRMAASRWGYGEIRTPTLESYGLFTEAGALTPEMLSRVYTFLDWDGWSGERVVIRPDSTVPVARAVSENELPLPVRLFYVQNNFRFGEAGTEAEIWQCGVEYIDAPPVVGDLEVAAVGCETLEALGVRPELRMAHAGFTRELMALLSEGEGEVPPAARDDVVSHGLATLRERAQANPRAAAMLEVACLPSDDPAIIGNLAALASGSGSMAEVLDEFGAVVEALRRSGRRVLLDLAMPADFEYYTGPVIEYRGDDGYTFGRGGRYQLCGLLGGTSAAGLGLDALTLAAGMADRLGPPEMIAVVPAQASDLGQALEVVRTLHRGDLPAWLQPADADAGATKIRVNGGALSLETADGIRPVESLGEVVPLLLRFK